MLSLIVRQLQEEHGNSWRMFHWSCYMSLANYSRFHFICLLLTMV